MRTTKSLLAAVLIASAGLAGCADTEEPAKDQLTTREQLGYVRTFTLDSATANVGLRFSTMRGQGEDLPFVATGGKLSLMVYQPSSLAMPEARLTLADLAVPAAFGPGRVLTDAELRFRAPAICDTTTWSSDGQTGFCDNVRVPVEIGGTLRNTGETLPLRIYFQTDLDLSLVVAPAAGDSLWLWIHGGGENAFHWGIVPVGFAMTADLDTYSNVIE